MSKRIPVCLDGGWDRKSSCTAMSGHYNSSQGFHVGNSTGGNLKPTRRRGKGSERVGGEFQENEGMVWSPAPLDTDFAPGTSARDGFSIGKCMEPQPIRNSRRSQRDSLIIPNIPINATVGRQGTSTSQSTFDKINELRRKGNHSFKMKDYDRACAKYSGAIVASLSLSQSEQASGVGGALLYCNRAAAYLALGKPEEALRDCQAGMELSPSYDKCRFRAATCLMRMGRFPEAREMIRGTSGTPIDNVSSNLEGSGISATSTEKVRRWQDIDEAEQAFEGFVDALLDGQFKTIETIKIAYKEVEALVPHAEGLVVGLVVGHIQLGDFSGADKILDAVFKQRGSNPPTWAGWCRVQTCYFKADYAQCYRNLQALNSLLDRQGDNGNRCRKGTSASRVLARPDEKAMESLRQNIAGLQELKDRGQNQMHRRAFEEAIETYTSALCSSHISPAMSAILFSNRAAAYQSIGQHALALADCCMAVAITPHFAKPHSRMASLLSELGLFLDAQKSIERAIACATSGKQRSEYQHVQNTIIHHRQQQMDHARLLGLHPSASTVDAKRAYRKLALKLHPDKTSQTLKRIEFRLTPAGALLQMEEETRRRMLEHGTWLFKQIGEAQDAMVQS